MKCRDAAKHKQAKCRQISIVWMGLSLLREQGGFGFLAGRCRSWRPRTLISLRLDIGALTIGHDLSILPLR
jgi:hypothetical protein